jgi:hypothetical protein
MNQLWSRCGIRNDISVTPNPNNNPSQPRYSKSPEVLMELASVSSLCRGVLEPSKLAHGA